MTAINLLLLQQPGVLLPDPQPPGLGVGLLGEGGQGRGAGQPCSLLQGTEVILIQV